jgi:hypothetical protein
MAMNEGLLLTNGCSFVWGDELQGYNDDPPTHYELTFTHHLGRRMRLPYRIIASCGNGNDKIFRDTIAYLSDPENEQPTHMVILWSAWQRQEHVESSFKVNGKANVKSFDNITQWSPERVTNLGENTWGAVNTYCNKMYDVRTSIIQHLSHMVSIQTLCKAKGIRLIQGFFHHRMKDNLMDVLSKDAREGYEDYQQKVSKMVSLLEPTSRIGFGMHRDMYTMALDMHDVKPYGHPGEQTHAEFAKILAHVFNTKFL